MFPCWTHTAYIDKWLSLSQVIFDVEFYVPLVIMLDYLYEQGLPPIQVLMDWTELSENIFIITSKLRLNQVQPEKLMPFHQDGTVYHAFPLLLVEI